MATKPKIGITMGDPNGIGAEVIVKALSCSEIQGLCEPLVFGSEEVLKQAKRIVGISSNFEIVKIGDFAGAKLRPGKVDKKAGQASISYIKEAIRYALESKIDAIVTAPITKESIHIAGAKHPGHTEMLQELTGAKRVAMMFEGDKFRVVLATIHCALSEVPKLIDEEKIFSTIELAHESLVNLFKIDKPRIVVCGLNPHAGEAGAFGNEEILSIVPAVKRAVEKGMDVSGPISADTLFYHAAQGRWDAVIAMYHDQGLIPFKMLSFDDGVNVTLGLPIIRTSPDHGTAYDIAWRGKANPSSMIAAMEVAVRLVKNKMGN